MKVLVTEDSKRCITMEEIPLMKGVINSMKEDDETAAWYAEIAINAAYDNGVYGIKIYEATAEIAKNQRVWNVITSESRDIDVWIEATAFVNGDEFIKIGAYISDIWSICDDNIAEVVSHMYIRKFKKVE